MRTAPLLIVLAAALPAPLARAAPPATCAERYPAFKPWYARFAASYQTAPPAEAKLLAAEAARWLDRDPQVWVPDCNEVVDWHVLDEQAHQLVERARAALPDDVELLATCAQLGRMAKQISILAHVESTSAKPDADLTGFPPKIVKAYQHDKAAKAQAERERIATTVLDVKVEVTANRTEEVTPEEKARCLAAYGTQACGYDCVAEHGVVRCASTPEGTCQAAGGQVTCSDP